MEEPADDPTRHRKRPRGTHPCTRSDAFCYVPLKRQSALQIVAFKKKKGWTFARKIGFDPRFEYLMHPEHGPDGITSYNLSVKNVNAYFAAGAITDVNIPFTRDKMEEIIEYI